MALKDGFACHSHVDSGHSIIRFSETYRRPSRLVLCPVHTNARSITVLLAHGSGPRRFYSLDCHARSHRPDEPAAISCIGWDYPGLSAMNSFQEKGMLSRLTPINPHDCNQRAGFAWLHAVCAVLFSWSGLPSLSGSAAHAQSLHFTRLNTTTVTCAEAKSSVLGQLRSRGYFSSYRVGSGTRMERTIYPSVTLDSNFINNYYYGAPAGRPQQLNINLSGDASRLYQGLLSSPVFMSSLGARIMEACPDIGIVSFNHWHEGGVPVGFYPDGTARTFQWVEFRDDSHSRQVKGDASPNIIQYEWGYYFSP